MATVFYRMKSENPGRSTRSVHVNPGIPLCWDNVRYLIEKQLGLHPTCPSQGTQTEERKSSKTYEYIEAVYDNTATDMTFIQLGDPLKNGCKLVVSRHPMPAWGKPYVPPHFQQHHRTCVVPLSATTTKLHVNEGKNEHERIKFLVEKSGDSDSGLRVKQAYRHCPYSREHVAETTRRRVDAYAASEQTVPTDPCYVCAYCGDKTLGHLAKHCPKRLDPTFVPVYRRRIIAGVPWRDLKQAETEEEKRHACRSKSGSLVVLRLPSQ